MSFRVRSPYRPFARLPYGRRFLSVLLVPAAAGAILAGCGGSIGTPGTSDSLSVTASLATGTVASSVTRSVGTGTSVSSVSSAATTGTAGSATTSALTASARSLTASATVTRSSTSGTTTAP